MSAPQIAVAGMAAQGTQRLSAWSVPAPASAHLVVQLQAALILARLDRLLGLMQQRGLRLGRLALVAAPLRASWRAGGC